jgi:iron complex outermembrane receptor protein
MLPSGKHHQDPLRGPNSAGDALRAAVLAGLSALLAVGPLPAQEEALEEIIVTAQRREERMQETPVAITAFTGAELEQRSIGDLAGVGNFTPNMNFSNSPGGSGGGNNSQIYIRGVGQNDFLITTDPGVAVYMDGVYVARSMGSIMNLIDMERVEVLRGPQGTLFGKNAVGGALSLITAKPIDEFDGNVELKTGSRDRIDATGMINLLLIPGELAARVAAQTRNQDGYGDRLVDGVDLGDVNEDAVRASLLWQPSDALTFTLVGDYSRGREESVAQHLVALDATNAPLLNLWNALVGFPSGVPMTPDLLLDDEYDTRQTGRSINDMDVYGISLTADWEVAGLNVKSITAYRDGDVDFSRDGDNSPAPYVETFNNTDQNQFSQELHVSGKAFSDRLDWLVGAYYFNENAIDHTDVILADGLFDALEALPFPLIPLGPWPCPQPPGSPLPCIGGPGNPINQQFDLRFDVYNEMDIESVALFGQGTWHLTDRWTITGGLRQTWESKDYLLIHRRLHAGTFVVPPTEIGDDWSELTPRAGTEYQWTEDLMTYFVASRGFKSGGFNGRPTTQEAVESYDPEFVWSYEIGVKSEWLERRLRLNAAAFHNDYTDIQLTSVRATPEGNLLLVVENAGEANVDGFEIEMVAKPAHWLDLSAGLGYTDAEYSKLNPGATVTEDTKFIQTPEWTFNASVQLTWPLADWGTVRLRGDYSYRDDMFMDANNTEALRQDGYGLVNARLAFTTTDEHWELALAGTNLTDKRYIGNGIAALDSFGTAEAYFGPPAEWALSLSYRY